MNEIKTRSIRVSDSVWEELNELRYMQFEDMPDMPSNLRIKTLSTEGALVALFDTLYRAKVDSINAVMGMSVMSDVEWIPGTWMEAKEQLLAIYDNFYNEESAKITNKEGLADPKKLLQIVKDAETITRLVQPPYNKM